MHSDGSPESPHCLVLLGGPGSGKGTHGQAIADALNWTHFSTGAHFRRHIEEQTPLGLLAQHHIGRGELVPDQATLALVAEILDSLPAGRGFILDGYPRSQPQALDLERLLEQRRQPLAAALYLKVSDEEILRRLSGRLTCRKCQKTYHREFRPPERPGLCSCGGELYQRDDDNPGSIRGRLTLFHELHGPLLAFYRDKGLLQEIPAEGPVPEVTARAIAVARQTL